jgi:hypothetical protein
VVRHRKRKDSETAAVEVEEQVAEEAPEKKRGFFAALRRN